MAGARAGAGGGGISIEYRADEGAAVLLPWLTGADHGCGGHGPATGAVATKSQG